MTRHSRGRPGERAPGRAQAQGTLRPNRTLLPRVEGMPTEVAAMAGQACQEAIQLPSAVSDGPRSRREANSMT